MSAHSADHSLAETAPTSFSQEARAAVGRIDVERAVVRKSELPSIRKPVVPHTSGIVHHTASSSSTSGNVSQHAANTSQHRTTAGQYSNTGTNSQSGKVTRATSSSMHGNDARLTDSDREIYRDAMLQLDPIRGAAVVATADLLDYQRITTSYAKALLLAVDLLRHDSDEMCATLATLLIDGWTGTLGDAFAAARTL